MTMLTSLPSFLSPFLPFLHLSFFLLNILSLICILTKVDAITLSGYNFKSGLILHRCASLLYFTYHADSVLFSWNLL